MNFEQKYLLEIKDVEGRPYRLECPSGTTWPDLYAMISKMSAFAFGNLKKFQESSEKEEEPAKEECAEELPESV